MPADLLTFERALNFDGTPNMVYRVARRWQLTNTRFLLGAAGFLELLNRQLDPLQQRFRTVTTFEIAPKSGLQNPTRLEELTAVTKPDGQYAVFEFTGTLPRAALYANWQIPAEDKAALTELKTSSLGTNDLALLKQLGTNDFLTLKKLGSESFDPQRTVLVADSAHLSPSPALSTNQSPGTVEFASYAPKRIVLQTRGPNASILMLTDKFDPNWKVLVDGKPAMLLRCNYIMRGVQVPAGSHSVEFRFRPPLTGMYVSLAAEGIGIVLIAGLLWMNRKQEFAKVLPRTVEITQKSVR
jgi:hypothetical protein